MMARQAATLKSWIDEVLDSPRALNPLTGDASQRHYYRVFSDDQSYVAMDSGLEKEKLNDFIQVGRALEQKGIHVPHVSAENLEQGFLLLEDMGDQVLDGVLTEKTATHYYQKLFSTLATLQTVTLPSALSGRSFDALELKMELCRFDEWFLGGVLQAGLPKDGLNRLHALYDLVVTEVLTQPQVFVHRDFHCRNIMVLPDDSLGLLDYQDALMGPVTYDVVSLLKDAYVRWDDLDVERWLLSYYELLMERPLLHDVSFTQFQVWFDWMAIQRQLKVIGIFSRLAVRDNKERYLGCIPALLKDVIHTMKRHPSLFHYGEFFEEDIAPLVKAKWLDAYSSDKLESV